MNLIIITCTCTVLYMYTCIICTCIFSSLINSNNCTIINSSRHINEDKRKTEKQMHMFELIRDIEDVPVISGCGI